MLQLKVGLKRQSHLYMKKQCQLIQPAHQQPQQHHEKRGWEIGQVISEIPGRGCGNFKFQTSEGGRTGGPARLKEP